MGPLQTPEMVDTEVIVLPGSVTVEPWPKKRWGELSAFVWSVEWLQSRDLTR